jgi:hypothetical protein
MKTSLSNSPSKTVNNSVHRRLAGLVVCAVLASAPVAAGAEDSFQMDALFEPSQAVLQAEARGRVMIYDGLDATVVERALDAHFGRIEHMMFVRIRRAQPDSTVRTEDDGC